MKVLLLTAVLGLISLSAISQQSEDTSEEDEGPEMIYSKQIKDYDIDMMDIDQRKVYDVCICS